MQQVRHEAGNFLTGDHYIIDDLANYPPSTVSDDGSYTDNSTPFPNNSSYFLNQILVGKRFRANRINDYVVVCFAIMNSQLSKIIDIDWLESILPGTEYPKNRQTPQYSSNIVNQNILFTK